MNRIERLTGIVLLLQRKPATASKIAAHFEVSRRTVLRDVQALCEIGVPVIAQPGSGGGYALPADYRLPALPLSTPEAFLLLLALGALRRLADTPFAAERASLEAKLRTLLTPEQQPPVEQLLELVAVDLPTRPQRAPWLDELIAAARDGRWVRITYASPRRASSVTVLPRSIVTEGGYWYCHAFMYEQQAERMYRVDRIRQVAPAAAEFQDRTAPSPRPYDHASHPEVEVALTASGVAAVEREPHLGSQITHAADGTGRLRFRCPPDELGYYARFFAALGPDADVQAPPALRERIVALAQALIAQYG